MQSPSALVCEDKVWRHFLNITYTYIISIIWIILYQQHENIYFNPKL